MKLKKNVAVSKTGFLFDPNTGESFNLNQSGQLIVKFLMEDKSESDITEWILENYEIEPHVLQRYFDDFFMMLRQFGLIEEKEEN